MSRKRQTETQAKRPASRRQKNVSKHSVILFWFTTIALLVLFLGRWIFAITDGYFASFVQRDASVEQAAANMTGLTLSESEQDLLLPLQLEWDLFEAARLCDEVTVTASDGTLLHGYLYNEHSNVTAVVLPRFNLDGTADFLPGPWLNELTGCNLLMIDPRAHGQSGGAYFGFGYLEQQDLAGWLTWVDGVLGNQTFILWGEGTGANTILFAASGGLLPDSVAFAVAESPYSSLHEMAVTNIWKWYQLPAVPFLYPIEWKLTLSDADYRVEDTDLTAALAEGQSDLPVLFLQSSGDGYIIPQWTQTVYDSYPGPKELISGGGNHGTVYAACREEIDGLLADMIRA